MRTHLSLYEIDSIQAANTDGQILPGRGFGGNVMNITLMNLYCHQKKRKDVQLGIVGYDGSTEELTNQQFKPLVDKFQADPTAKHLFLSAPTGGHMMFIHITKADDGALIAKFYDPYGVASMDPKHVSALRACGVKAENISNNREQFQTDNKSCWSISQLLMTTLMEDKPTSTLLASGSQQHQTVEAMRNSLNGLMLSKEFRSCIQIASKAYNEKMAELIRSPEFASTVSATSRRELLERNEALADQVFYDRFFAEAQKYEDQFTRAVTPAWVEPKPSRPKITTPAADVAVSARHSSIADQINQQKETLAKDNPGAEKNKVQYIASTVELLKAYLRNLSVEFPKIKDTQERAVATQVIYKMTMAMDGMQQRNDQSLDEKMAECAKYLRILKHSTVPTAAEIVTAEKTKIDFAEIHKSTFEVEKTILVKSISNSSEQLNKALQNPDNQSRRVEIAGLNSHLGSLKSMVEKLEYHSPNSANILNTMEHRAHLMSQTKIDPLLNSLQQAQPIQARSPQIR